METNEMNNASATESEVNTPDQQPSENEPQVKLDKHGKPKKTFLQELKEWVVSLVAAVVIVLLLQNFVFTLIRVDGRSMNDTLADGERLFVTVADVKFGGDIERGTVVICHYPNRGRTFFVKRVVGVPGDQVFRKQGVTYVAHEVTTSDGKTVTVEEPLDANFISAFYNPADDYEPYTLGTDEYFVVGDNRGSSHDSRDWNDSDPSRDVGPIGKDMITGRVRHVIWPLSKIRPVN